MSVILLVDDDGDMLKLTSRWLTKAGYETKEALSGGEALELLKKTKPDLILLDYAMPGMDGPQTLEKIREDESIRNIPVIFRTGKEDTEAMGIMETLRPTAVVSKAEGKLPLLKAVEDALKAGQ